MNVQYFLDFETVWKKKIGMCVLFILFLIMIYNKYNMRSFIQFVSYLRLNWKNPLMVAIESASIMSKALHPTPRTPTLL